MQHRQNLLVVSTEEALKVVKNFSKAFKDKVYFISPQIHWR